MALIKVKNTWTQVPNTWLKDESLSLRAKGLLTMMQSLPDGWNFSVSGLASITKEGLNAVRSTVHEIEGAGYLRRTQVRDKQGKIADTIWTLYEAPQPVDEPSVETRSVDGAIQLNTNKENTNKKGETPPTFSQLSKQDPQEGNHFVSGGKAIQRDAETVNGNPFEKQSIYDAVGTTRHILRENERKRRQIEVSEVCLAVAEEFGDARLAKNKKLRPRVASLLAAGYTRWDIVRVAHNWHNLKDKQGQLFGFGIFSDVMFPVLLKQEPKPEIWTR